MPNTTEPPSPNAAEMSTGRALAIPWPVSHPITVLVAAAGLISALAWFAPRFEIDASPETLLTEGDEDYVHTRIVNRRFDPEEFVLIAYEPLDHPLFSETSLRELDMLARRLARIERVSSVRSMTNVPLISTVTLGDAREGAASLASIDDAASATWRERHYTPETMERALRGHPIYEDLLLNADGTAAALQVVFERDPHLDGIEKQITDLERDRLSGQLDSDERDQLEDLERDAEPLRRALDEKRAAELSEIRAILAEVEGGARLYVGGAYVLANELIAIIERDLVLFGGAIAGVIVVLLALLFRRLRWILITALCCAGGVVSTLGTFALVGLRATVISSSVVALQLILTLAVVVHLIVEYQQRARQTPDASAADLIRATIRRKTRPCLYAAFTTSIGFASLIATDLAPVRAFGYMMILAIGISLAVSLILFPALLALLPAERSPSPRQLVRRVLDACEWLALDHGRGVAIATVIGIVVATIGMTRLDVENSFIDYFRTSTRIHQELAFIDRELGGTTPLDLVYRFDAPPEDVTLEAGTVQLFQQLQQRIGRHAGVGKILSVVDLTAVAKSLNGDRPITEYELTAFYRTIDEGLRDELLSGFFSRETNQLRMSIRIQDSAPGIDRTELLTDIRRDLDDLGIARDRYELTNAFVLYENMLQQLFSSQILTLGIVLVALGVVFAVLFGSIRVGAVAMVPNLLAGIGVLGTMGWLGLSLDLMTITVAAIALGIAADDTVHFVHSYLESRGAGGRREAAHATYRSVGDALLSTSIIIAVGFGSMVVSDFVPTVVFGALTALAMLLALLADLIVLPVLLVRFVPLDRAEAVEASTGTQAAPIQA